MSNKVIINRDERIEVEWKVSCSSWHSDDIVKSTNITYLGSWSDDWNICVQPLTMACYMSLLIFKVAEYPFCYNVNFKNSRHFVFAKTTIENRRNTG